MKTFLSLAITLFCAVQCWAANPSFQSFDTNDFIAVSPTVKLRHSITNGTNIFNNYLTIYTNSTIINADTLITNTTTTIFNSFTTNITESSVIVNTNVFVENNFTTNFFDNSTIVISNTFVIITNSGVTIDGTNVATINPTIGRVPYKSGTNSFDDTAIFFIDTNTVGATEIDAATVGVTNLVTGGIVVSVDSGLGFGYLTNMAFSDTLLWTNDATAYKPTQAQGSLVARGIESYDHLTARGAFITQLSAFQFLIAGENDIPVSGDSYVAVVGSDALATNSWLRISSGNGIGQHLFIVNSAAGSGFHLLNGDPCYDNPGLYVALKGGDWATTTYGDTIELLGTFNGWAEVGRFWDNTNNVSAIDTWTNSPTILQPVDTTKSFAISTNAATFTGAVTNVSTRMTLQQPSGGKSISTSVSSTIGSVSTTALEAQFGGQNAATMHVTSNLVYFGTAAPYIDLASSGDPFRDGWWSGSIYAIGLPSLLTTNYSRLALHHAGTNGLAIIESQAGGIAGSPVPIALEFNATNIFQFDMNGVITLGPGTSNLIYRIGNTLVFTNNASTTAAFSVGSTSGNSITMSGGSNSRLSSDGSSALFLQSTNGIGIERTLGAPIWYFGTGGGNNLIAATDGGPSVGGISNNRPDEVRVKTAFRANDIVGITTTWTNVIVGVITQRISTIGGIVVTNLTL